MAGDSIPAGGTMRDKIAAAITAWAKGQRQWTPVPTNDEISADLDFTASPDTFRIAKRRLAEQGVIVRQGRWYYVAAGRVTEKIGGVS